MELLTCSCGLLKLIKKPKSKFIGRDLNSFIEPLVLGCVQNGRWWVDVGQVLGRMQRPKEHRCEFGWSSL